jgi:CRISPR/Cas system-associated exonuclease Cas4 (RecB family)
MKPFLKELAEKIHKQHPKLDEVMIVFPNRRASLFFRKYLGELLTKPAFSPRLVTIEDFILGYSNLKVPDKLELISRLYRAYHHVVKGFAKSESGEVEAESFDQFYFWGEMLLRDFDEADKYMVNADHLFKDLSHQKELDSSFDFLTDEQQEFLKSFWSNFDETQSLNKKRFLHVWRQLPAVYKYFKQDLKKHGLAFEGMLHREVADNLTNVPSTKNQRQLKFAGFNALTSAEELILGHFVENENAEVYWDLDDYYVNNKSQEAGKFFRQYQDHRIFRNTFATEMPSNFHNKKTGSTNSKIKLYGAAQPIGQAKLMSEILEKQLKDFRPEETLIVLPDEKLLIPVLHGISGKVDALNVTMGFPLSSTPLFNLIEILIDLQITGKDDHFNHRQTLAILGHPYVIAAGPGPSNNKRKEILKHNWVQIPGGFLATEIDLHRLIFKNFQPFQPEGDLHRNIIQYLKAITIEIGKLTGLSSFDKEYAFHFLKFFNRLEEILSATILGTPSKKTHIDASLHVNSDKKFERDRRRMIQTSLKSFMRLLKQLVNTNKIPFSGEPLKGLQVMGVLETRNLDFKNVFILSLNEGAFPAVGDKGSYIPFNIRKAYNLPTVEHKDAIYSYLFYRVLQRAENIFLFYNSETDVLGQGEMSRYLQQLIFESGIEIEKKILSNPIQPLDIFPISVAKEPSVIAEMVKLNEGNAYFQGISPSALNTYIECRLRFYFRHVAKIKEPNEVEEELDARVLGNFLHDVMEKFYSNLITRKRSQTIEIDDFEKYPSEIENLIDEVFIKEYRLDPEQRVVYEGQRLVVKEIVIRFAHRIIEIDKQYAPFTIEALEQGGMLYEIPINHPPYKAVLSGKIDRVDSKENILRIIDYKTGKDKLNFESITSLFSREGKRNKAAFQTLLYALLYQKNFAHKMKGVKIVPGLINRMNLFDDKFSFGLMLGKDPITDADQLLTEFETLLQTVFDDLFNPDQPFDQTTELDNCKMCPYGQLCYR